VKVFDFFLREYLSVWPQICRALSQIQSIFLGGISGKNYFGIVFHKFCANQGYPLQKNCEISLYFLQFYPGFIVRWKNSHKQYHILFEPKKEGTSINKRQKDDTGKKIQDFFFGKPVLFTLGVGLTTPYSLGILVWKIYHTLVIVSIEFWRIFEPKFIPQDLQ